MSIRRPLALLAWFLLAPPALHGAACSGRVVDATGAGVEGARIEMKGSGGAAQPASTDANGAFRLPDCPAGAPLAVSAPGFQPAAVTAAELARGPVVLQVASVVQQVVVTSLGTPVPLSSTPESVVTLDQEQLQSLAALSVDDKLRQVPGVQLFRRTGSRSANPTAQGVSLRGLGGSGASRSLVIEDGVPLNDPFGGWVYWDRVPQTDVAEIEVLRGGGSYLYGSPALSGVIQIVSKPASVSHADLDFTYGNQNTPDLSLSAGTTFRRWIADGAAEGYRTNGYFLVAPEIQGAVDTRASLDYGTGTLRLGRKFSRNGYFLSSLALFDEGRNNGTALQVDSTRLAQLTAHLHAESSAGVWDGSGFGIAEHFYQTFSAVSPDRSRESLTRTQQVPEQEAGGGLLWSDAFSHQLVVAGVQLFEIRGHTDEIGFVNARPASRLDAGGRQRIVGLFADDSLHRGRLGLDLGVRLDLWNDYDGSSDSFPLSAPAKRTFQAFADRSENALSPHAGLAVRATDRLVFTASGYGSFRGPTLNELYRGFRVGNVVTLANPFLKAERLAGGEFGAVYTAGNTFLRANFFWAEVRDPVANVTLKVTPALITRQRQNLGNVRSAGIELDVESRLSKQWSVQAGYRYVNPVITGFPADPSLVGLDLPQVPRHVVTFSARFAAAGWTLAAQGRAGSRQFDDDQNLLPLDPYFTLDTFLARRFSANVDGIAAIENVLDQRYEVARTPVFNFGPPIVFRLGVRLHLAAR